MKRRYAALASLFLILAAFGWWRFGTRIAPAGQPPLVTIDPAALAALRDEFNRTATGHRVIALLSPT